MIARQLVNQGVILERKSAFVDDRFGAVSEHFDQFTLAERRGPLAGCWLHFARSNNASISN
jgi:hypothetical protein